MNNKSAIADIIIVIATIIVSAVILIFPIFATFYVAADKNKKTVKFSASVFGLNVFYFNVKIAGTTVIVAKTFKEPYKTDVISLLRPKKPMPKIKGVSLLSVYSVFNIGIGQSVNARILAISAFDIALKSLFGVLKTYKPYLNLTGDINVYERSEKLKAYLRVKTAFNIATILYNLLKYLSERIYYAIVQRKQNKQRNRKLVEKYAGFS